MKKQAITTLLIAVLGAALVGCGSNDAPGWDSESKAAAEALNKAGNDLSKITPEQRAALERAAGAAPGGGGGEGRGLNSKPQGGGR